MELTQKLLTELQRRLKIGNRRGVHLNAIPANSRYKFDLQRLEYIDKRLPSNFIKALLSEQPLKFRITWKNNVPDLNSLFEEEQTQLVKITKAFENLINQTEAIESEKGINTFGFGFPILIRRDIADNKLTVSPVLIWSLRIKRTKEFNTWEILRNEDDPIYINEVLINHLQNDANVEIEPIPSEMLDDGLIEKDELVEICTKLIQAVNSTVPIDLGETFKEKIDRIGAFEGKAHYEKLIGNSTNSVIDFCGLFSIFEVQKQNIIDDYSSLLGLDRICLPLEDLKGQSFQPISSVETDPSQQSILHSLESTRNVLIQGPPGTGKSQTLTAILINALENNKKTLVVCEKKTALEVLHNALVEKGLNYNCVLIRDIVKDRKIVVDSVRDRVDKAEYKSYSYKSSKHALDKIISGAKNLISSINAKHQKLDKKIIGSKSWTDVVGDLLAELKNNENDHKLNIDRSILNYSTQELDSLLDIVQRGQSFFRDFSPIEPISFINTGKLIGDNPYLIEQTLKDDFEFYENYLAEIKVLLDKSRIEYVDFRRAEFEWQNDRIRSVIDNIQSKGNELSLRLEAARQKYFNFRRDELRIQADIFHQISKEVESIYSENRNNADFEDDTKIKGFPFKFLSLFSKTKKKSLEDYSNLQRLFSKAQDHLSNSKDIESIYFQGTIREKLASLQRVKANILEGKDKFEAKINREFSSFGFASILEVSGNHFQIIDIFSRDSNAQTQAVLESLKADFESYLSEIELLFNALRRELFENKDIRLNLTLGPSYARNIEGLHGIQSKIESKREEFEAKVQNEFRKIGFLSSDQIGLSIDSLRLIQQNGSELLNKFNLDNWLDRHFDSDDFQVFISELEKFIDKKRRYFDSDQDFFMAEFRWFKFYNGLSNVERVIINELKPKIEWRNSFLIFYLDSLLRISAGGGDLPENDQDHRELDAILSNIEKEQLKYIKEFWISKQIDATQLFVQTHSGITVENLYNKRSGRNFKRLTLRQIVQKDIGLFSTFFPIILTTPDVASNLFKGMIHYFDIVMFDEASQLRLEDNLPALLKGKQIIIAGDEHQMPPSNYFSKVFDGAVEDEDDIEEEDNIPFDKDNNLLSCESLLDFGAELNFQKKHLDFHYRSKHPFLIDFSNFAFYNQRLRPLPNNFDYTPIKFIQVNGTFSDHTNEAEAEMVLSILDRNINRLPNGDYPTVGIATFNIAQRNLIKSKILERQKFPKFAEFNAKIQELEDNGLFVKNLENIQGDERDVIILSTTYGEGKDGKFVNRFGPINHSKGYKLLNVIITRAKFKVYCCCSIPESVFLNYKDYLTLEGSNNKRAVLFAYLAYCKAVSESDNDSRVSVLNALADNYVSNSGLNPMDFGELESPFEEEVYQYLVDHFGREKLICQFQFAGFRIDIVYDSKIPGVPKIAIECDGAKYHSSREAYLYDRHRQKILEDHGFVFHRIWSTNWWRNSKREAIKLIKFIQQVELASESMLRDNSATSSAFTDDILLVDEYVYQTSLVKVKEDVATIQQIDMVPVVAENLEVDRVKLNSKVQIKYLNDDTDIWIQIVSSEINKVEGFDGIRKVYFRTPLANSLLGQSVGSIVKVGNLDKFVEILNIGG